SQSVHGGGTLEVMKTSPETPQLLRESAVNPSPQRDLFGGGDEPAPPSAGLFAEIVFDRPLDHAYTYAVPDALRGAIAVGKRVQAPFGRGDKPTVGYCVGLGETAPGRSVKEVRRVLD